MVIEKAKRLVEHKKDVVILLGDAPRARLQHRPAARPERAQRAQAARAGVGPREQ
jgi:hypothetical protein